MENRITVDVIIPTYKPEENFKDVLLALKKQSYPISHVMIMNTEEVYWNHDWDSLLDNMEVYHIKKEDFDHGRTRDEAAQMSLAHILVYMTQDAMPMDRKLIELLVRAFSDPTVGAAYARQMPREDCDPIERYTRSFNYPDTSYIKRKADLDRLGIKTYFCSNVCAAYRRDLYFKLNGFPKHTIFNEDMIYAGRLVQNGFGVAYAAGAKVIHSHNYGCMQQFHRNFDMAVSQAEYPDVFEGVKTVGEGVRLVLSTAKHLFAIGKGWLVVSLFFRSGFKFLGYAFGKRYKKLPKSWVRAFSMNKKYWEQEARNNP